MRAVGVSTRTRPNWPSSTPTARLYCLGAITYEQPLTAPPIVIVLSSGTMIGAFIIGIFIEVSTLFIPAELKFVGALVVLIIVLLIRPQGLLGKAQRVG